MSKYVISFRHFGIELHCINCFLPLIAFVTSDGTLYASAAAAAAAAAVAAGPGTGGKVLHYLYDYDAYCIIAYFFI